MRSDRSRCERDGSVTWSERTAVAFGSAFAICGSCSAGSFGSDERMRATCCWTSTAAALMSVPKTNWTRTLDWRCDEVDSRMSMPETLLTAFSIGRVTVVSMVSGDALGYVTLTEMTGGAKVGSSATAK